MKSALFVLATLATAPGFAMSLSLCKAQIADSQAAALHMEDRFHAYEVTLGEVNLSKLALLNVRFECRDILYTDYCAVAVPLSAKTVEQLAQASHVGAVTARDMMTAIEFKKEIGRLCQ